MPDETTPPSGGTPGGATPQGETPTTTSQTGETPGSTATLAPADLQREIERLSNSLKRANAEAKAERESASELKKFKEQIETEKLSAQEKAEKRLADLQKQHEDYRTSVQERVVTGELRASAATLGFADPTDAVRLLDRSELECDSDGIPTNAPALLEKLAKAKPYLLKQQQTQGNQRTNPQVQATNPSRSQTSGPQEMSKEYVSKVMAGGKDAWSELSPDEQSRISGFIQKGGMLRR